MKDLTLTISDDANPLPRVPLARRFPSKTANNQAQSAVFSLKLSLIAAIGTTYKPIFADKKVPQVFKTKALNQKPIPSHTQQGQFPR